MAVPLQNYQKHLLLSTQIELLVYYMLGRHVRLSGSNSKRGRIGAFSARTYNAEVQGRIRNHFVKNRRQRSCEEVVILIYTIHKQTLKRREDTGNKCSHFRALYLFHDHRSQNGGNKNK